MAYVVTQSCCADAACVVACPVNCIHPAPGEPGFATAEMLHIDPKACVGCGACVTACPAGAIKPESALTPSQQPFKPLNAEYYEVFPHADRAPLALVPQHRRLTSPGPFRVAIVGSGPAGLYTADELLKHPEVAEVVVFERLGTPHGLARFGVAPDHVSTRGVSRLFEAIERERGFRYELGVEVGRDVSLAELREQYDAVVYAVGASSDRALGVPGEDLPGSLPATGVVGWYNGHPEKQDLDVPLDHERAVVIGNGNVALDIARVLTADHDRLESHSAIAPGALTALRAGELREVVVLGRRGPAEAAFTVPELIGLTGLADVDVVVEADPAQLEGAGMKLELLRELASRTPSADRRRIVLRFAASPVEIIGEDGRVTGVEVMRNELVTAEDGSVRAQATGETEVIPAGLVVRAIGHRGLPVADLPFDEATGTVPSTAGRVEPGVYVVGWIKRGPSGFIGTNKSCAQETVECLLDDLEVRASTSSERAAALAGV